MSFGFNVIGDRDQAAAQLEAIRDDESQESLRNGIAALLAEHINLSELHGYKQDGTGWRQVYAIEVSGHSGPQSAMSLSVSIKTPYIAATELPAPVTLTALAEAADAAIARFEYNLGFTAPELYGERIKELRSQVRGIFEPEDDETDPDDEG